MLYIVVRRPKGPAASCSKGLEQNGENSGRILLFLWSDIHDSSWIFYLHTSSPTVTKRIVRLHQLGFFHASLFVASKQKNPVMSCKLSCWFPNDLLFRVFSRFVSIFLQNKLCYKHKIKDLITWQNKWNSSGSEHEWIN